MRDVSLPFRTAVAALLQGNISVNCYDEKRWVQATDTQFVLFTTQQQTPRDDNDCTWISDNSIDIEIYDKTGSEASKNDIDNIANEILAILIPAPFVTPLASPNLQFGSAVATIISRNLSTSETETILQKVITFSCVVTQQT